MKKASRGHLFFQLLFPIIALSFFSTFMIAFTMSTVFSRYQFDYVRQESEHVSVQITSAIDSLLDGYVDIIHSLTGETAVKLSLNGNKTCDAQVQQLISKHMFRMKGRIEIHILSFSNGEHRFSSGSIPHLYRYNVYHVWKKSILNEIEAAPHEIILHATHYKANASSDSIVFSVGKAVLYNQKAVGCVIIDVYRSELYDIVRAYQTADMQQVTLFDQNSQVILDTLNVYREGLVDPGIKMVGLEDPRRSLTQQTDEMTTTCCRSSKYGIFTLNQWGTQVQLYTQRKMQALAAFMLLGDIFLSTIFAWMIARKQTKPFMDIKRAMEQAAVGNWDVHLQLGRNDEMLVLEEGFNHMVEQLRQYMEEKVSQESLLKEAQIRSLQAQINPHFLMNTLASIRALARKHAIPDIQTIADELSALFAYNVYGASKMITLREDITIIKKYIAIQNIRFGNKFQLEIEIPEALMGICLPPLILQTIVENAIIHGLEDKLGPGQIRICAKETKAHQVLLSVWDNGMGMDETMVHSINEEIDITAKSHIGLRNAKHRIKLCFGDESRLWVESQKDAYTVVKILIYKMYPDEQPRE